MNFQSKISSVIGVLLLFCLTGCGERLCFVTGKVTLDGAPLADVNVMFTTTTPEGKNAMGRTDANGVYTLQTLTNEVGGGTTKGNYTVTFSKLEVYWDGKSYFVDSNYERKKDERSREVLPKLYNSDQTSPFKVEISKSKEIFDFDLKSNP